MEPTIILELRKHKHVGELIIADSENDLTEFLQEQYRYEVNRLEGKHKAFENTYKRPFFDLQEMLNYYMNPWADRNEKYFVDLMQHPLVIYKQLIQLH